MDLTDRTLINMHAIDNYQINDLLKELALAKETDGKSIHMENYDGFLILRNGVPPSCCILCKYVISSSLTTSRHNLQNIW